MLLKTLNQHLPKALKKKAKLNHEQLICYINPGYFFGVFFMLVFLGCVHLLSL